MIDTTATLTFIETGSWPQLERPYELLYEPDASIPRCNFSLTQVQDVPIHDLRPEIHQLSLDRQGFIIADLKSRVSYEDYFDQEKLKSIYLPELKVLLREVLQAKAVYVHETVIRRSGSPQSEQTESFGQPIPNVHTDYTHEYGQDLVGKLVGDKVDEVKKSRYQMLNVWKPLRGPLRSWPLAVCDLESLGDGDLIALDEVHSNGVLESQQVIYKPSQRWCYLSQQKDTEVIIFKSMDSEVRGEVPHGSFVDPLCPNDEPPRESIEFRVLVVY